MKPIAVACLLIAALAINCSKGNGGDNPPPPPPPPGGGTLSITSTSPEYVFWGKELTINGTGFSATPNDNIVYIKGNKACDPDTTWQKAQVVSATATKLVVKVPYITKSNGTFCGNDWGRVRVTIGNKSVLRDEAVKFVGKLEIGLCDPFGVTVGDYPNTYRPGDSSVMTAHLQTLYTRESGYYDKIKIYCDGVLLNTVDRTWPGATCSGLTFVLELASWCDLGNCTRPMGYNGDPARKFRFIGKVEGTDISDTTDCYIFNHPNMQITGYSGATSISKSAGGNPYVTVTGKYMFFNEIEWTTPGENAFHTSAPVSISATEYMVYVPLSLMNPGKSYVAVGKSNCGFDVSLFTVGITN